MTDFAMLQTNPPPIDKSAAGSRPTIVHVTKASMALPIMVLLSRVGVNKQVSPPMQLLTHYKNKDKRRLMAKGWDSIPRAPRAPKL